MVQKALCIIFDKVDGYIRKYDRTKILGLFHSNEKLEKVFDKIGYPAMLDVYTHKYMEIKIDSGDELPLEKTLSLFFSNKNQTNVIAFKWFTKAFIPMIFKCYIIIDLMFLKVWILVRQVRLKNVFFVTTSTL